MPNPGKRHDDVEQDILTRIAQGEPLAVICRSDPERFPTPMAWGEWLRKDEDLAIAYARAREVGFDAIAAEVMTIADDKTEDPASRRVRVDARLKLLAKWDPKRYGEALLHKHADADGGKIELDEVGRATRLAAIFATLEERRVKSDDAD